MAEEIKFRSLILTGGLSTRMGGTTPKHLLPFPSRDSSSTLATTILDNLLSAHQRLSQTDLPWSPPIIISVRSPSQKSALLSTLSQSSHLNNVEIIIDTPPSAGPTSGLLAAHHLSSSSSSTHYIVTGSDYPLLPPTALQQLLNAHIHSKPAITCFVNESLYTEPLLAVWSPLALDVLHQLVLQSKEEGKGGHVGPNHVVKMLERGEVMGDYSEGVVKVKPGRAEWIVNVNTREEYEWVRKMRKHDSGDLNGA